MLYFTQFTLYLMAVAAVAVVLVLVDTMKRKWHQQRLQQHRRRLLLLQQQQQENGGLQDRDFLENSSKVAITDQPSLCCDPPRPRSWPIIGHLHLLGGYSVPYQAFSALGQKYGSVISLRLGSVESVVVNGQESIREVLVTKGHHFDSRPNFERYQQLFCGNKENSLAFCDWSDTQKTRREMLRAYTFPRAFTNKFATLEELICKETNALAGRIFAGNAGCLELKPLVLESCANIFLTHFCSKTFDAKTEPRFLQTINNFDDIFWEVNQGYAADFLPFLMPLHTQRLRRMNELTHQIRNFIKEKVIEQRFDSWKADSEPQDYVESLIEYVKFDNSVQITWNTALFALEDIIGGHSAVGNFLVKLLAFLVQEPDVQRKIKAEVEECTEGQRDVTIADRTKMPYTEAVIFEAIRLIASPIVPRVANQDSTVNGYKVKKDTVIFLNNYDLSMSEKLWDEPTKFMPERFLKEGRLVKPEYFLPFGGGRRSCMGYKMVQLVSFGLLAGLMQKYQLEPVDGHSYEVSAGSLALPRKSYSFRVTKR